MPQHHQCPRVGYRVLPLAGLALALGTLFTACSGQGQPAPQTEEKERTRTSRTEEKEQPRTSRPAPEERPQTAAPTSRARLTGNVRLADGRPVTGGILRLDFGNQGGISATALEPEGSFYFSNLPVGTARVSVETASVQKAPLDPKTSLVPPELYIASQKDRGLQQYNDWMAQQWGATALPTYVPIAPRFASFESSGLTVELVEGKNHRVIFVTTK